MSIKIAIAEDNPFFAESNPRKAIIFKDMDLKFHSYNGWNFSKNWNKIPISI